MSMPSQNNRFVTKDWIISILLIVVGSLLGLQGRTITKSFDEFKVAQIKTLDELKNDQKEFQKTIRATIFDHENRISTIEGSTTK